MKFDSKLQIIIGAYGSGKSEISVNIARTMKENSPEDKILLADMDIVNPFYRSSDASSYLQNIGVRTIVPSYANSNVDAPVLTGEMYVIFDDPSYRGVFDIGGEDMGATVLGSLKSRLKDFDKKIYMVVNTLRPFTSDVAGIVSMTHDLQEAAGFSIDGYINNTNLLEQTTSDMILEGEKLILEASKISNIPLVCNSIMEGVMDDEAFSRLQVQDILLLQRNVFYGF